LNETPAADYANNINAGTATASYTYAETANYLSSSDSEDFTIGKAATTTVVTIAAGPFAYTGSAQTPATVSVTGAGGLNETPAADYANNINAGTATASYTYAETANYLSSSDSEDFTIGKAAAVIAVTPYSVTYDGNAHTSTFTAIGVETSPVDLTSLMTVSGTTHTNAATYNGDAWSFSGNNNYNATNGTVNNAIGERPITITANSGQFKYCGQADPTFIYTASEALQLGNSYSGSLGRAIGNGVGTTYGYTLGSLSAGTNYTLTLGGTNTFEIKGVTIDASSSSNPVQLGNSASLSATVKDGLISINGVSVTFTVINGSGVLVYQETTTTSTVSGVDGVANLNVPSSLLPLGLYQVNAVAGSGCSTSTAYLSVYDPNGGFVTGGGWIMSPVGAYLIDTSLTGKANFGFVAKYKKGNNQVDGNTEFQFKAGDFNFKSNFLESGTLVISGAKATYRGTGTVNGAGNYGFMVSAIDGQITGGGGADKFRIKIWDKSIGNAVVYDNQINFAENADANAPLGGGSIVIHEVKKNSAAKVELEVPVKTNLFNVQVFPNPAKNQFTLAIESDSNEKVTIAVYDVLGRIVEQIEKNDEQPITFGEELPAGAYVVIINQGIVRKVVRLIKE
ncbi:T9SS type A sorting domain-containing protein, partial [Flavobacterium sp.]|uniref:T9SS type A sorting domain-containing protein n=1 Tax=Flavobacterium sp. TaxID=239 RepID=UPI002B4B2F0B